MNPPRTTPTYKTEEEEEEEEGIINISPHPLLQCLSSSDAFNASNNAFNASRGALQDLLRGAADLQLEASQRGLDLWHILYYQLLGLNKQGCTRSVPT